MTATRIKRVLSIQPMAERGGSDQALLRMIRSLTGDGWQCHVALPAQTPMAEEFAAAGATLHVIPMRRITTSGSMAYWVGYLAGWPVAVVRLTRLARRIRPDVIHSNSLHSWYGFAVARLTGTPHIWHAREIVVQSGAALRLERWLAKHAAAQVIAISKPVAEQLDRANVVIVHDPADPAEFSPRRAGAFRRRVGVPDDVPLVGAVGRIDTWKGFDILLDAVPLMQAARPEVQVVAAGPLVRDKESYAAGLAAIAGGLGGVHWLGPRSDIADLLADLDVFVLPSTLPEPFGLVVVEALACGVPVVATAAGGPVEILGEAGPAAGRLIPVGDPGALAEAVIELIERMVPAGSSTALRRERVPLTASSLPEAPTFVSVFDGLVGRSRPDRGLRGRRRTVPR